MVDIFNKGNNTKFKKRAYRSYDFEQDVNTELTKIVSKQLANGEQMDSKQLANGKQTVSKWVANDEQTVSKQLANGEQTVSER